MDQVIITAALTGAVTPKAKNAHIPITPEEIAADAYACWKAGAAMVHLHMRADDGLGAMDKEKFRETTRPVMSLSTAPPPALLPSIPPRMKSGWPITRSWRASRWAPMTPVPSTGCPAGYL